MVKRFEMRKGLSLPLAGEPRQEIADGPAVRTVALVGDDYHGMKPTML
ncbi:MAG: NADH:ubiquinone reductase (Na(+)-transporting) subunit A, partial [Planctomycetota bacterium]